MNDICHLKLFLKGMGMSDNEVNTLKKDDGNMCPNCKSRKTCNWAYFAPCGHFVCYTCLDYLYDTYVLTDRDTLFVCPFCKENVLDWSNKISNKTKSQTL